jgi:hypothetical protein
MFELAKITTLIDELAKLDLENVFNNLHDQVAKYKIENANMKNTINNLYLDIENKNNKIIELQEEIQNYRKVSFIQSVDKQLTEKINYINILETQIEKYKKKEKDNNHVHFNKKEIKQEQEIKQEIKQEKEQEIKDEIKDEIKESVEEKVVIDEVSLKDKDKEKVREKKRRVKEDIIFDPDNFEEINGYELLSYKRKYYLRDLETSEIYDILDNQPNIVVGLITPLGKLKFN